MQKMRKNSKSKFSLPAIGLGALLADQVVASMRSSFDEHSKSLAVARNAMDQISSDGSAVVEADISQSLKDLNDLVQSELEMVSSEPADLQFSEAGLNDSNFSDTSTNTSVVEGFVESEVDNSILLAQADGNPATVTDQSNPVLAQLAQNTSPSSTTSSDAQPAEKAASVTDGDGFSWPLMGGALAGLAVLSGGGSDSSTTAPTESPTSPLKDIKAPTATVSIADKTLTAGEQTTITVTFSELVKDFELSDLNAPNGVLSDLVQSSQNPLVWTAKFVPTASTEDLTNTVTLSGPYADLAGNAGTAATSENYIVATQLDGGTLADGYIDGATVFRDLDGDGIQGNGENSVETAGDGTFAGLGGYGGTIVAFGGTDISTGLKFQGVLKAPDGSEVINPLTTMVSALTGDMTDKSPSEIADTISAAEDKVANLLGIDPDLGAITQIDPLALIAAGGPDASAALSMQLQALQVANVLVTLTQTIVNSGVAADASAASLLIADALVDMVNVASESGSLDLTDSSVINGLFTSVVSAASESGDVSASALASLQNSAEQASDALAAVNGKIDAIDPNSGIQGLTTAVAAQLVIVGENGLLNALSTGQEFSTDNLDQLINDNLDNVKDVVRPTDEPTGEPTDAPTGEPTDAPTDEPTDAPTDEPTDAPTDGPDGGGGGAGGDSRDGNWDVADASDPDRPSGMTVSGSTYTLNTSLSALAASGIRSVTNSGTTASIVANGYGSSTPITDLVFDEDSLRVSLNLTASDDALDASSDGTVNLNTSLSSLASMGIDRVTVDSDDIDTVNVLGYGSADPVSGIVFHADPDVNLLLTNADDALDDGDSLTDGTVNLNTSLSALRSMGIDTIEADSGGSVDAVNVLGYGSKSEVSGLAFADGLDVTLQLTDADDALTSFSNTYDGTVNLNTSLSALSNMGIDSITGDSGTSVVVSGGLGGIDLDTTNLTFADGLDVTLELSENDLTDVGTVNLSSSLSALDAMGIDTLNVNTSLNTLVELGFGEITAETTSPSIVVTGGLGGIDLDTTDLTFADGLDVTIDLSNSDIGSISLNSALSSLTDMGIDTVNLNTTLSALDDTYDTITGASGTSVVVTGGLGGIDLDTTDLMFADGLDVTLQLSADDVSDGTVSLNTSLSALSTMGIDSIEADSGGSVDAVNVQGYGSDSEISGLEFADALDVTLQLTDADDALDDGDSLTDGTVNLSTSLSALSSMGIDTIEADSDGGVGSVIISGGFGEFTLSQLSSLGLSFADELSVTVDSSDFSSLGLTDEVEASLLLGTGDAAETLRDMGIDIINTGEELIDLWA